MQAVRAKDTAPELAVRRTLHANGFRFRLHDRRLPGTPDIVLRKFGIAVFVQGCFWHSHHCRHGRIVSKTNSAWWTQKLTTNRERDRRKKRELRALGWKVVEIWECEVKNDRWLDRVRQRLGEIHAGTR